MRRVSLVLTVAAAGCGVFLGAGTAGATPVAAGFSSVPVPLASQPGHAAKAPAAVRGPLAGYLAPVTAASQTFAARFVVAAVTCPAQTGSVFVTVGAGSTTAGRFLGGLLQVECRNGAPRYLAGLFDGRSAVSDVVSVAVGDTITVSGRAGTSPTATLKDVTTGQVVTGTTTAFTADTGQFTVQSTGAPIPTFAKYTIRQAKASGAAISSATATRYTQVSDANKVQLTATALSNGGFSVRYVSQG